MTTTPTHLDRHSIDLDRLWSMTGWLPPSALATSGLPPVIAGNLSGMCKGLAVLGRCWQAAPENDYEISLKSVRHPPAGEGDPQGASPKATADPLASVRSRLVVSAQGFYHLQPRAQKAVVDWCAAMTEELVNESAASALWLLTDMSGKSLDIQAVLPLGVVEKAVEKLTDIFDPEVREQIQVATQAHALGQALPSPSSPLPRARL